jgi:hypothetical protein
MPPSTVNPPPRWLVHLGQSLTRPTLLRGTARQVAWAEALRRTRLASARYQAPALVDAFLAIEAASWWSDQAVRVFTLRLPEDTPRRCPHRGGELD